MSVVHIQIKPRHVYLLLQPMSAHLIIPNNVKYVTNRIANELSTN